MFQQSDRGANKSIGRNSVAFRMQEPSAQQAINSFLAPGVYFDISDSLEQLTNEHIHKYT